MDISQITLMYAVEEIPNEDKLFYRIHINNIDLDETDSKQRIKPSAFDPMPKPNSVQMSVNWSKYMDAVATKQSAKNPIKNGVLSFIANNIRNKPINLNVTHQPTANRAHSIIHDVVSEKNDPEIRLLLRDSCNWEIPL